MATWRSHLVQYAANIPQRNRYALDRVVQAADNGLPFALESGVLHPRVQFTFGSGPGGVKVVLNLIKVALVLVGDLLGDVALAYPVNILGGNVKWPNESIYQIIDTLKHHLVLTIELVNFRTFVKLAIHGGLNQSLNLLKNSGIA